MGFGTSTPDLSTGPQATFDGLPAIAVGNVVGSNVANILPILGLAVVILLAPVEPFVSRRDGTEFAVANLFAVAPMLSGVLDRRMGSVRGRPAPRQSRGSPTV